MARVATEEKHLIRDTNSKAVINTDRTAFRCGFTEYQDCMTDSIEEYIRQELEDSD